MYGLKPVPSKLEAIAGFTGAITGLRRPSAPSYPKFPKRKKRKEDMYVYKTRSSR